MPTPREVSANGCTILGIEGLFWSFFAGKTLVRKQQKQLTHGRLAISVGIQVNNSPAIGIHIHVTTETALANAYKCIALPRPLS